MYKHDSKTATEMSKFRYFLGCLKAKGSLPLDYPIPAETMLADTLTEHFGARYEAVLDELISSGELLNIFDVSYSPTAGTIDETLLRSFLANRFNSLWVNEVKDRLEEVLSGQWHLSTEYIQDSADDEYLGEEQDLTEEEDRFINQLSLVVMASHMAGAIDQIILPVAVRSLSDSFKSGLGLTDIYDNMVSALVTNVGPQAEYYYAMLSATSITSTRNMGRIFQTNVLGIQYMIWKTAQDEKVCERCAPMDGKRFKTENLMGLATQFMEATSIEQIKEALPWVKVVGDNYVFPDGSTVPTSADGDTLAALGIGLPPLHGLCRCEVDAE